jgi:hypothetical protein
VLNEFSRKYNMAAEAVTFNFLIQNEIAPPAYGPPDGAFVHGLFLEGASYDVRRRSLRRPLRMFDPMPVVRSSLSYHPPRSFCATIHSRQ